jgi:hypothetical protein
MRSLSIKFDCPYSTHLGNMIFVMPGMDDLLYKVLLSWFMYSIPCVSRMISWIVGINKIINGYIEEPNIIKNYMYHKGQVRECKKLHMCSYATFNSCNGNG